MKDLLDKNDSVKSIRAGEIVEGTVVGKGRSAVFLDLGPVGTGKIYGKEFFLAKDKLKNLKIGDKVSGKVIDIDDEDGFVELSVSSAFKQISFDSLKEKKEKEELIKVKIIAANKGGLMSEISGIDAFLPVSQLSSENYPKIEGGDKTKILKELQKFVGQELEVKILDLFPRKGQIILSEKAKDLDRAKEILENYKVGDIVEGEITGITDFGAFIRFPVSEQESQMEGLIHISEIDWKIIEDPSEVVNMGDKIKAKIIDISKGKASLSLKALKKDPWQGIESKYEKGKTVQGKVTKFNPFGAFVQLDEEIQALCHISEFAEGAMEDVLEVGKEYDFKIVSIDEKEHRMSLRLMEKPKL